MNSSMQIVAEVGKPKMDVELYKPPEEIDEAVREYADAEDERCHPDAMTRWKDLTIWMLSK